MWDFVFICDEVYEDVLTFTIGNDDTNAGQGDLAGSSVFGVHAATAKGAFLFLDVLR